MTSLKEELACAVCLEQYTDPRTLPCLHSFCTGCLENLPKDLDGSVACPSCRAKIRLPQGNVCDLPKAFFINRLLEIQNLHQKASGGDGNKEAVCDNCTKSFSKFYCSECDKFICPACNDVHKKWSSLSNHVVMGIEEVSEKAKKMVSAKPAPVMDCPNHKKPLEVYCVECEQPICYLCTIKDHKGHDHNLVNDAYEESKQRIRRRLKSLEERIQEKMDKSDELKRSKKSIQAKVKENKAAINKLCDDFVEKIEKVRHDGLQATEIGTTSRLACEDQQIKEEELGLEALYSCKEHVERSLEISTPAQLLVTKKQILARFDELVGPEYVLVMVEHADNDGDTIILPCHHAVPVLQENMQPQAVSPTLVMMNRPSSPLSEEAKVEQKFLKNLRKDVLSIAAPLQYPEMAYKECELKVVKFPEEVYTRSESSVTFALLYKGQPMLVNKEDIACHFLESATDQLAYPHGRQPRRVPQSDQNEIECSVDYFIKNDTINYQVSFTASRNSGTYTFNMKIGSNVIDTKGMKELGITSPYEQVPISSVSEHEITSQSLKNVMQPQQNIMPLPQGSIIPNIGKVRSSKWKGSKNQYKL